MSAGQPPCKRHRRGDVAGWMPVDHREGRIWAIAEVHYCARCGHHMAPRMARGTIRRTQREAMLAYGLPLAEVDAFFPPAPPAAPAPVLPGQAIAVPLACWPFPVSTFYPRAA